MKPLVNHGCQGLSCWHISFEQKDHEQVQNIQPGSCIKPNTEFQMLDLTEDDAQCSDPSFYTCCTATENIGSEYQKHQKKSSPLDQTDQETVVPKSQPERKFETKPDLSILRSVIHE
ncbi:hypothetical protein C4D60_Mb09t05390 [Musa balbisiana]|uniref:Uncharacterized protein n=1 Tax=Musa balbisiana TaxID=52838 RepID=A0A4S8IF04_MUSBA|nr:hypothetical protein C4D60_Mb09t05390 [Musa balbisiana]